MKTAQELALKISPNSPQENYKLIQEIQLDAFKAGAEWAASQVVNFTIDNPTVECGLFAELHYLIKQEASNLKEPPK